MADFAMIKDSSEKYPRRDYVDREDQAYGFIDAFKLQTGTMRGRQALGGQNIVIDNENRRIIINDGTNDRVLIGFDSGGF